MSLSVDHLTIMEQPKSDRPQEKMMKYGVDCLTNAELIGIIIRTGCQDATAVELGQRVLRVFEGDLSAFHETEVEELMCNERLKGIGPAKACQIKAAIELGRRMMLSKNEDLPRVKSPKDVADHLMSKMDYLKQEHFKVILLDNKNNVLKIENISIGTLTATLVHPRDVFSGAIRKQAASVILVHNHPSGDPSPSQEDIAITKRLVSAGEILGISVFDHIIIGKKRFASLKEFGYM